jgi:invasion protein IalB
MFQAWWESPIQRNLELLATMIFNWTTRFACLFAAIAVAAPVAAQTTALPGGASSVQETFESWTVACVMDGAAKRCDLTQQQTDQQSRQRVLAIELSAATTDKVDGALVLPFGLAPDRGVTLHVDDAPAGPILSFRTCLPAGCVVPLSFDARLLAA